MFHFFIVWGPVVMAAVLAVLIRLTVLRRAPRLSAAHATLTVAAGALPALAIVAPRYTAFQGPIMDLTTRAVLPLALGVISVLFLIVPLPTRRRPRTAQLTRRTIRGFLRPVWPIALLSLTATVAAVSVSAGLASRPDDLGHYTLYWIRIGTEGMEAGAGIYGWHYSLPSLVTLVVLLAVTFCAWLLIPRPAWRDDIEQDAAERRLRAANIGRVSCAAVLAHLAVVLQSLRGTATLVGSTQTEELGLVTAGTSFAAIGPALHWASAIAFTLGLALWLVVAICPVPAFALRPSGARTT